MNKTPVRVALCFLGAVVVPLLMTWAYLYVSRTRDWNTASSDKWALVVCLLVGLVSIAALPTQIAVRVLLSLFYVPLFSFVMFLFALSYVCGRFGACL